MLLRRLYFTYKIDVLNYHHKVLQESGISTDLIPEAYLSSASQGNFLEVLNMALNGINKILLIYIYISTLLLTIIAIFIFILTQILHIFTSYTKQFTSIFLF